MRLLRSIALYAGLALGANMAWADTQAGPDTAALEALRQGDMKKLIFRSTPKPVSDAAFTDADGNARSLADYRGKYILLNFWATWCPPCRAEMPSLARLQEELGGDRFEVVTVATGRNTVRGIREFFESAGVDNLPVLLDPKQKLARDMGVFGLPISVVIDPGGREIARLTGDADWSSESAISLFRALISGS